MRDERACKDMLLRLFTLLDLCVSSLRRGHANLLCIVPILTDDPRRESLRRYVVVCLFRISRILTLRLGRPLPQPDSLTAPRRPRGGIRTPARGQGRKKEVHARRCLSHTHTRPLYCGGWNSVFKKTRHFFLFNNSDFYQYSSYRYSKKGI